MRGGLADDFIKIGLNARTRCHRANGARLLATRRFPPPWSVEEQPACFVVRDHNGQALAYIYFEDEPGQSGGEVAQQG